MLQCPLSSSTVKSFVNCWAKVNLINTTAFGSEWKRLCELMSGLDEDVTPDMKGLELIDVIPGMEGLEGGGLVLIMPGIEGSEAGGLIHVMPGIEGSGWKVRTPIGEIYKDPSAEYRRI